MRRILAVFALASVAVVARAADDVDFDLVTSEARDLNRGVRARLSMSIVPRPGRRLMPNGPVVLRPFGEGVSWDRPVLFRADAVDPAADVPRFEITFVPKTAGTHRLTVRCTFYVCDAKRCRPVESEASWSADVSR